MAAEPNPCTSPVEGGETTAFRSSCFPSPTQTRDLHDLLRSNTPPTAGSTFQAVISAAPVELDRYDAEIAKVQTLLDGLVSDRNILATYADGCRSIFAPIRRVLIELLAKIFELCLPEDGYSISDDTTPKEEVDRVAHWYLLQLAQVSSLWHTIAMGTPRLWSSIVVDTNMWRKCPISSASLFALLERALKRSGNHPLKLQVGGLQDDPECRPVFELLSRHAPRWQEVYFWSDLASSTFLAGAKGHLDRLEMLILSANWGEVDIFQVAPRLNTVSFSGPAADIPGIPWSQLRAFTYIGEIEMDPWTGLSLLGRCHPTTSFCFDADFPPRFHDIPLPHLSSNVQSLILRLTFGEVSAFGERCPFAAYYVGKIFESLTLPSLQSLTLIPATVDSRAPPGWNMDHFLMLAERSSFHNHLVTLQIHTLITDVELLRALSVLPLLESLIVLDYTSHGEHISITDTLLHGLTRHADDTVLIPNLNFLSFTTLLRFTDSVYLAFVASRVSEHMDISLETRIWLLPGRQRELSPQLLTELSELESQQEFGFRVGAASQRTHMLNTWSAQNG
ncbi:hypothetical protein C8R47DRAFT_1159098 [Mycena vitilis]|nr:hypothetical protein C8R47DRAFT_1159098 [Mycena vitilis]